MTAPKVIIIGYMGRLEDPEGRPIGTKGVGKDTLAEMLSVHVRHSHQIHSESLSFADSLKNFISVYFDLPRELYDKSSMKEVQLLKYPGWTYRKFLEVFGTEIGRATHQDMWVELMRNQIQDRLDETGGYLKQFKSAVLETLQHKADLLPKPNRGPKLIQITDVRFKNEYDMLKSMGAVILQVKRRLNPDDPYQPSDHVSNQVDPSMEPDIIVDNSGSLIQLSNDIPRIWQAIQK